MLKQGNAKKSPVQICPASIWRARCAVSRSFRHYPRHILEQAPSPGLVSRRFRSDLQGVAERSPWPSELIDAGMGTRFAGVSRKTSVRLARIRARENRTLMAAMLSPGSKAIRRFPQRASADAMARPQTVRKTSHSSTVR